MDTQKIVAEIDAELSRLHQVKALLTGTTTAENRKSGRNSMAGSSGKKRTLSAEARERIAAAQRARWAKSKKAAKEAGETTPVSARKKGTRSNPAAKSAKKRTVSSEARARMAAGQKARWAKLKTAAKKTVRGADIPPVKRTAIPAKAVRKSAPAKKARFTERAGAPNTKTPPVPTTPVTVGS